jgi:hypothetical protein
VAGSQRQPQELPNDTRLTQYGEGSPAGAGFRDRLRVEIGETEISMILGEVDRVAASVLVTRFISPWAERRVTTVGCLREAGFRVEHSPTRGNPLHVSVFPPSGESGDPEDWGDELAKRFNACFTEHVSPRVGGWWRRWLSR